ncbi:Fe-S cluster assembly protein NifU [Telmatospirillum sp.]|uniref:Fe-S cluster assembly protein NifU n=1 Tax=Telmatospirillum sp. TaxID=2079197 RepID=UPI00283FD684|nr:Fe-S cluster assembly protein NifU [Telmatospirillum sp.]MDR3437696.1 Fe-S cluster assembly protein NifU [Telmatospirillum sp.]
MWEYSDKVKEYFFNPKNAGVLAEATAVGEVGAMSCGDALRLQLKIDAATEVITDARFQTFGCGSAIASSSALTELIIGKTLADAMRITNQDIADFLGGLPPEKMHCSVMGYEALRAAVANYRGEAWEDDHEDGALVCKCFGIDEGMIDRAIRMNSLTTVEQVAHYTKVTGSCGTCAERVEEVLTRVNRAMVDEGLLKAAEAFDPAASARIVPRSKPVAAPAKLTTLQRLRQIEQAIEEIRPTLRRDGGDCELIDIEGDTVSVKLTGACMGCQMASLTVEGIQQRLIEKLGRPLRVIPLSAGH